MFLVFSPLDWAYEALDAHEESNGRTMGPSGLDGPSSSGVELRINIYDFAGTL